MLLVCAIFVFLTLVTSIIAVIRLSNFLIRPMACGTEGKDDGRRGAQITRWAGASFFSLVATGFCILLFFAWRTFSAAPKSAQTAIETVRDVIAKSIDSRSEGGRLESFEISNEQYIIRYSTTPGGVTYSAVYDPHEGAVQSIKRQP